MAWKPWPNAVYADTCSGNRRYCHCVSCYEHRYNVSAKRHARKRMEEMERYGCHHIPTWIHHNASIEVVESWLANPICWICERPIDLSKRHPDAKAAAVDHNHACCPKTFSCGQCIRGLAHAICNRRAGAVENLVNYIGIDALVRLVAKL